MLEFLCIETLDARIRYHEYAMRIITEDNIDQLDTMSYSDNARKLLWTTSTLDDKNMFKELETTLLKIKKYIQKIQKLKI